MNGVESPLHQVAAGHCRFPSRPVVQQSPERPQQEVTAATGRVDEPDLLQAELRNGRFQGAFEDELLDENGGLQ